MWVLAMNESLSFVFFVEILKIRKLAQHLSQADIIPLLNFLIAKLGKNLRQVLVFIGNHIFSTLRHIDIDIFITNMLPLKQSFFHELSAIIGNSGLVLF